MMEAYQKQISFLSSMRALADEQAQAPKAKDIETMEKLILSIPEEARMLYVRRMLPSEYEKLQGFPVEWTAIDSEQLAMPSASL